MILLCMSQEFTPLYKMLLHMPFLDYPMSIFGFCWHGWGDPGVTCFTFLKRPLCNWILWSFEPGDVRKSSSYTLAFLATTLFLDSKSPKFSVFCSLDSSEFFILSSCGSSLSKFFLLPYIFPLVFYYKKSEETKPHI